MILKNYCTWREKLYEKGIEKNDSRVLAFLVKFRLMAKVRFADPTKAETLLNELMSDPLMKDYPWWKMLLRHFRLQIWISFMGHINRALTDSIDTLAVLEEPEYDKFPQQHCLINDIVSAYIEMDPVGYYGEIVNKIGDQLAVIPRDMGCRYCFLRDRLVMLKYGGDLDEAGRIVEELLLVYTSSPEYFTRDVKSRLFLNVSDVYLARGKVEKAVGYLEKVTPEKLATPFFKAKYHLVKGHLGLETGGSRPSASILDRASEVLRTGAKLGCDLLKWKGQRLAGEYYCRIDQPYKAVDRFVEALTVMENLGSYKDEGKIALLAGKLALECGHPELPFCFERAWAANKKLRHQPFTRTIERLLQAAKHHCFVSCGNPGKPANLPQRRLTDWWHVFRSKFCNKSLTNIRKGSSI